MPPPAAQNRSEPETYRALSDMVSQSLALQKTKPLELTPLNAPIIGLLEYPVPVHGETGHQQASRRGQPPDLTGVEIRNMLASPGQDSRDRASERAASASTGLLRRCRSARGTPETIA